MPDNDYVQIETVKQINPDIVKNSVVDFPKPKERGGFGKYVLYIANTADDITSWSTTPANRDKQLRDFWPTEPMVASAIYAATSRISAFEWEIVATDPNGPRPKNTIRAVTRMLANAEYGNGWFELLFKTLIDIYTQDNGAFWQLIRTEDRPDSPVINITHLDSARCERTGNQELPVLYRDRNGRETYMKWYQVLLLEEMPSPIEEAYGVQYCALTRCLRAAQILRDIEIYKREKVSGNFSRAVHLVSGVNQNELDDAMIVGKNQSLNMGLLRYSNPIVIAGLDPTSGVDVKTINLASLPDAFDEDSTMKWYIAQLALTFGVDYQEFAPLPGGNLGSSQQSDILHMKTQGKGPALMMKMIEHMLNNNGILPRNVKFQFMEHDLQAETAKADASFTRGKDRVLRVKSGELDLQAARELAVLSGDLPEHMVEAIESRGVAAPQAGNLQTKPDEFSADQVVGGMESDNVR
jgi:hypothetical protein